MDPRGRHAPEGAAALQDFSASFASPGGCAHLVDALCGASARERASAVDFVSHNAHRGVRAALASALAGASGAEEPDAGTPGSPAACATALFIAATLPEHLRWCLDEAQTLLSVLTRSVERADARASDKMDVHTAHDALPARNALDEGGGVECDAALARLLLRAFPGVVVTRGSVPLLPPHGVLTGDMVDKLSAAASGTYAEYAPDAGVFASALAGAVALHDLGVARQEAGAARATSASPTATPSYSSAFNFVWTLVPALCKHYAPGGPSTGPFHAALASRHGGSGGTTTTLGGALLARAAAAVHHACTHVLPVRLGDGGAHAGDAHSLAQACVGLLGGRLTHALPFPVSHLCLSPAFLSVQALSGDVPDAQHFMLKDFVGPGATLTDSSPVPIGGAPTPTPAHMQRLLKAPRFWLSRLDQLLTKQPGLLLEPGAVEHVGCALRAASCMVHWPFWLPTLHATLALEGGRGRASLALSVRPAVTEHVHGLHAMLSDVLQPLLGIDGAVVAVLQSRGASCGPTPLPSSALHAALGRAGVAVTALECVARSKCTALGASHVALYLLHSLLVGDVIPDLSAVLEGESALLHTCAEGYGSGVVASVLAHWGPEVELRGTVVRQDAGRLTPARALLARVAPALLSLLPSLDAAALSRACVCVAGGLLSPCAYVRHVCTELLLALDATGGAGEEAQGREMEVEEGATPTSPPPLDAPFLVRASVTRALLEVLIRGGAGSGEHEAALHRRAADGVAVILSGRSLPELIAGEVWAALLPPLHDDVVLASSCSSVERISRAQTLLASDAQLRPLRHVLRAMDGARPGLATLAARASSVDVGGWFLKAVALTSHVAREVAELAWLAPPAYASAPSGACVRVDKAALQTYAPLFGECVGFLGDVLCAFAEAQQGGARAAPALDASLWRNRGRVMRVVESVVELLVPIMLPPSPPPAATTSSSPLGVGGGGPAHGTPATEALAAVHVLHSCGALLPVCVGCVRIVSALASEPETLRTAEAGLGGTAVAAAFALVPALLTLLTPVAGLDSGGCGARACGASAALASACAAQVEAGVALLAACPAILHRKPGVKPQEILYERCTRVVRGAMAACLALCGGGGGDATPILAGALARLWGAAACVHPALSGPPHALPRAALAGPSPHGGMTVAAAVEWVSCAASAAPWLLSAVKAEWEGGVGGGLLARVAATAASILVEDVRRAMVGKREGVVGGEEVAGLATAVEAELERLLSACA